MKKVLLLLSFLLVAIPACTAGPQTPTAGQTQVGTAGPASTQATPTEEPALETQTLLKVKEEALNGLSLLVWVPYYGAESEWFQGFVNTFNESNEWGIQVTAVEQINYSNLYENVTASLPREEKPGLVIALPEHAQEWYAAGAVTDLTDYVRDPKYGVDTADMPPAILGQDLAGEARAAYPAQRTAAVLLWNQTWAKELGFSSAPDSPQDFQKQACGAQQSMAADEFAENDALGGWLVNTDPMTAYSWLKAFGGDAVEGGNYHFLTPNNIDSFSFLRQLSEAGCSWQSQTADPFTAFAEREALFITTTLKDLPQVEQTFSARGTRDEWAVLPFPASTLTVYGSSYVVLNSTPEEQLAAWLFVRWLTDPEQDARWVENTHLFPLHAATLALLDEYGQAHPQWEQAVHLLPEGIGSPALPSWRTVKIMLGDGFAHMYRVNTPSGQVAAILAQMESMAKDLSR